MVKKLYFLNDGQKRDGVFLTEISNCEMAFIPCKIVEDYGDEDRFLIVEVTRGTVCTSVECTSEMRILTNDLNVLSEGFLANVTVNGVILQANLNIERLHVA